MLTKIAFTVSCKFHSPVHFSLGGGICPSLEIVSSPCQFSNEFLAYEVMPSVHSQWHCGQCPGPFASSDQWSAPSSGSDPAGHGEQHGTPPLSCPTQSRHVP